MTICLLIQGLCDSVHNIGLPETIICTSLRSLLDILLD